MKRIAVLVIAATHQPVYRHYIETHWTETIRCAGSEKLHIDVFLLFENAVDISGFEHLRDNIIRDPNSDLSALCDKRNNGRGIPGILSKTIYALELLGGGYDVFFRTNLSSIIKLSAFDRFVQAKSAICYSGAFVWVDALRRDLLLHDRVGPGKSIESLSELDEYEGNTFVSGSGFFLNAEEAEILVRRKDELRYDIVDDVAVGLMLSRHEVLPRFTQVVRPGGPVSGMVEAIRKTSACHIRLQHFPLTTARELWTALRGCEVWR